MNKLNKMVRISLILGVITLIGLLLSILALIDIYHNSEPDLSMEWNTVRVCFIVTVVFISMSVTTIIRIRQKMIKYEIKSL